MSKATTLAKIKARDYYLGYPNGATGHCRIVYVPTGAAAPAGYQRINYSLASVIVQEQRAYRAAGMPHGSTYIYEYAGCRKDGSEKDAMYKLCGDFAEIDLRCVIK